MGIERIRIESIESRTRRMVGQILQEIAGVANAELGRGAFNLTGLQQTSLRPADKSFGLGSQPGLYSNVSGTHPKVGLGIVGSGFA
ncbi:MAG: hypothetical protein ACJASJ_000066 [Candidatus Azotimanducaceae bacterium]|jgi:hypothetical protein